MEKLYAAIKDHSELDDEQIIEAANHGADAGWSGFTYYSDTCEFTKRNQPLIKEIVLAMAEDLGESSIPMIQGFVCLKDQDISEEAVSIALFGTDEPEEKELADQVDLARNALAWFALEGVGHWLGTSEDDHKLLIGDRGNRHE